MIAHRLDDVAVCTAVAVLSAGRVAEAGPPLALLDRPVAPAHGPDGGPESVCDPGPGAFAAMAAELGPAVEARVRALAAAAAAAAAAAPQGGA